VERNTGEGTETHQRQEGLTGWGAPTACTKKKQQKEGVWGVHQGALELVRGSETLLRRLHMKKWAQGEGDLGNGGAIDGLPDPGCGGNGRIGKEKAEKMGGG